MARRPLFLALLLAFAFLSGLHAAPPPSWQPAGPSGAWVNALLIDFKRPGVVYASADQEGVYRSADGGMTWKLSGLWGANVSSLAQGPSAIYAGTLDGLYASYDDGSSWKKIWGDNNIFEEMKVEADPVRGTLLMLISGGVDTEVARSTDGGKHWSWPNLQSPYALAMDKGTPGTYYVGGYGGIFRSTDAGATWKLLPLHDLDHGLLAALAVDPVTHVVYAGGRESGVFSSNDRGATWRHVALPDGLGGVTTLAARSGVVCAGVRIDSEHGPINVFFVSTDGGAIWRQALGGINNAGIGAVAIDPRKPRTVYIGTDSWGVFKSTDAVAHWKLSNHGLRGVGITRVAVDPSHPGTLWTGTDGAGLWKTVDGGRTWQGVNESLGLVSALALDPRQPTTVFAANGRSLVRSLDGGIHWKTLTNGIENASFTAALKVDPQRPATVYAGTTKGVFRSADGGASWSAPDSTPQCTAPEDLSISAEGTLFAAGYPIPYCDPNDGSQKGGILASTDGGAGWKDQTPGAIGQDRLFVTVAVDPNTPSNLYGAGYRLFHSTDGGASWQQPAELKPFFDFSLSGGFTFGPGNPATVYTAFYSHVLASTDGGASWAPIQDDGLRYNEVDDLAYDPATRTLYAATVSGLFSLVTH